MPRYTRFPMLGTWTQGVGRLAACMAFALAATASLARPYSYVALHNQSQVAVYDHGSNTWIGAIAVGNQPVGIGADAAQRYAYVSNFRSGTVTVVRTASRAPVATVAVGNSPMGVAVSQAQPRAYVANFAANTVTVIATATNTAVATINVGQGPTAVATSASGDRVFVANTIDNTVSVIDVAANAVTQTIAVITPDNPNARPYALAFVSGAGGSRLLVANNNAASVSIFDGSTYALLATLRVGAQPTALARATANKVYVLNSFDSSVHTIDPFAASVTAGPIAAPASAVSMATAVDGSLGAIAAAPASFSTLNTSSNAIAAAVVIPGGAQMPLTLGNFVINPAYECALDLNGDNAFDDTDTTLIARYLMGVRGTTLVSGVAGISAASAEGQLGGLTLDADNDGTPRATTDGVLLRRASKGLVGTALTGNVLNSSAPGAFVTSTQVINWIVTTHGANCLP